MDEEEHGTSECLSTPMSHSYTPLPPEDQDIKCPCPVCPRSVLRGCRKAIRTGTDQEAQHHGGVPHGQTGPRGVFGQSGTMGLGAGSQWRPSQQQEGGLCQNRCKPDPSGARRGVLEDG